MDDRIIGGGLRTVSFGLDITIHVVPAPVFQDESADLVKAMGATADTVAGDEFHQGAVSAGRLVV